MDMSDINCLNKFKDNPKKSNTTQCNSIMEIKLLFKHEKR